MPSFGTVTSVGSGRGHLVVALLREAWVEYEVDRARYLAVAMIYYALLSVVPLLSLLLAALGLMLRFTTVAAEARQQMLAAIEGRFGPDLSAAITGLLTTLQQESIIATSSAWSASSSPPRCCSVT
jgi:uncharacterized BrkB/YihY/UPF0761 family membrane protein